VTTTYFDTSVLVAVYVNEPHSGAARRALAKRASVPFIGLHWLELRNALELLVGRSQLSAAEREALLTHVAEDVDAGRLVETAVDLDAVIRRAIDLSAAHTRRHFTRSLDLLHIAAAQELKCSGFVTGDRRQLKVARAAKLRTTDITRRTRRAKAVG
jgi:predicted nucleic acid-binding protein